ncbi:hypothetical protein [Neisseria sp. N177_16]|uniref:hypothetical protein n=1 Tax=Neisseria sp. N177_16 TaxID=2056175 RepID=UPI000C27F357|nr:hypothetical protein [Neisseria sp. N177_16]PJO77518.1 hypothetical protein CWC45_09940 [Neisseria sp. N177_16]
MDVILIIGLIVLLIVALAVILSWAERRKKAKLEAEKQLEQENALSRQAAKEKMQVAVVANHGDEPLETDQADISDNDLNKIKAAYAKFEKDVLAWETKLQVKSEFSGDEEALIRKEQLKYRMYFEEAFYEKHGNSITSQEWRQWTDAFSELLERHARLIAEEELPSEDDEEEDETVESVETETFNKTPSETPSQQMPSENHQAAEVEEVASNQAALPKPKLCQLPTKTWLKLKPLHQQRHKQPLPQQSVIHRPRHCVLPFSRLVSLLPMNRVPKWMKTNSKAASANCGNMPTAAICLSAKQATAMNAISAIFMSAQAGAWNITA